MNIEEIKEVVDKILDKKRLVTYLNDLKKWVDDRSTGGLVTIDLEGKKFQVQATDLKNIVDVRIAAQDTTDDERDLKEKTKDGK